MRRRDCPVCNDLRAVAQALAAALLAIAALGLMIWSA